MEKQIAELVLGVLKRGADISTLKELPDLPPNAYAEAEYIYKSVQNSESNYKASLQEGTGDREIWTDDSQFTDGLRVEVEQAQVNKRLEDNFLKPAYPVGKKGFYMQMQQQGYGYRKYHGDEFIQPNKLNEFITEANPDARMFEGEEYQLQSGGKSKKVNPELGDPSQRPLAVSKVATRRNSKRLNQRDRATHPKTQESKDMNTLANKQNQEEIKRRKLNGTYENNPYNDQFVMMEHDIRLTGNPLWDLIGKKGNEAWNLFIQSDPKARFFKDSVETWFYKWTRNKGNNWYLKTDRANGRDIILMEVSTNKKLGVIPFDESFFRGKPTDKAHERAIEIIRAFAEGFKE